MIPLCNLRGTSLIGTYNVTEAIWQNMVAQAAMPDEQTTLSDRPGAPVFEAQQRLPSVEHDGTPCLIGRFTTFLCLSTGERAWGYTSEAAIQAVRPTGLARVIRNLRGLPPVKLRVHENPNARAIMDVVL